MREPAATLLSVDQKRDTIRAQKKRAGISRLPPAFRKQISFIANLYLYAALPALSRLIAWHDMIMF